MKSLLNIKQQLHQQCQSLLNQRLQVIKNTISNLQDALQSETKSTAGDKHETGRAMVQLEREKAGQQLAEAEQLQQLLNKINPEAEHKRVALGSVVNTTNGNYFIAISLGELKANNETFYAISPATPIAKLVLSKTVGDTFQFRDRTFTITKIH